MLFIIEEDENGYFYFRICAGDKKVLTDIKDFDKWTVDMMESLKDVLRKISKDLGDEETYKRAIENYEDSV